MRMRLAVVRLMGVDPANDERNGIIRNGQSRKAATNAKKDTVRNRVRPFKLATLAVSVMLCLGSVALAHADDQTGTSTADTPALAQAEAASQRQIASITEKTQFHRGEADKYAHKMRAHLPAAHGPLTPVATVASAERRLHAWVGIHRKMQAKYKAWRMAQLCKKPRPLVPATITVKHHRANLHQRQVLTEALNAAHKRSGIRFKTYQALVAGITQESTANNKPAGDGSSVGVLQLISSHGSVRWRMHIPNSVNWFLNGVIPDDRRNPSLSVNDLVQRQQGSGHPSAYGQWTGEASRTVKAYLGPCLRYTRT